MILGPDGVGVSFHRNDKSLSQQYHITARENFIHQNVAFFWDFHSNLVHFAAFSITVATQANIFNLDLMRFY